MRRRLDESLPKRLKLAFPEHEIYNAVHDRQWPGIQNGELLQRRLENDFAALLTFDKNLRYQQNFSKYTITVFVLTARINQYEELTKLTPQIKAYLLAGELPLGPIIIAAD